MNVLSNVSVGSFLVYFFFLLFWSSEISFHRKMELLWPWTFDTLHFSNFSGHYFVNFLDTSSEMPAPFFSIRMSGSRFLQWLLNVLIRGHYACPLPWQVYRCFLCNPMYTFIVSFWLRYGGSICMSPMTPWPTAIWQHICLQSSNQKYLLKISALGLPIS